MELTRTTVRIPPSLKKATQEIALSQGTNFQNIVNAALEEYLNKRAKKKAKKIVFPKHDLGVPLDNLTRDDFYGD